MMYLADISLMAAHLGCVAYFLIRRARKWSQPFDTAVFMTAPAHSIELKHGLDQDPWLHQGRNRDEVS
jgi:hypothetical protein